MKLLGVFALMVGLGFSAQETTLTVKVSEPDSDVEVLDEAGKVAVSRTTDHKGTLTIAVEPGQHRLKVKKIGFDLFTKDFEMESGGKRTMTVKLVRLKDTTTPIWRKLVADLPAERQMDAVAKKLKELNPGFDGAFKFKVEKGAVVELEILTDNVTDLFPLRVLAQLKALKCVGSGLGQGRLSDLTPIKGMLITGLTCSRNPKLSDLSPLKGMPLRGLHCDKTNVSDLSPLKDMKLGYFNCGDTPVADLSPLKGMPLAELLCDNTQVSDLSPLKGMTLKSLSVSGSQVSSLSPLKDLKLTSLNCGRTRVSDLSPLQGMQLTVLNCQDTDVSNFSPLREMPLKILWFTFNPKRDSEILRSTKTLETINDQPAADFLRLEAR